MTVFLVMGRFSVAEIGIVTAPSPQLNVMTPPAVAAACSAPNVQLAAVPVPTTAVGLDVSAGWPFAGTPALHEPFGLPAPPVAPGPPLPPGPLPPAPGEDELDPELQPTASRATGSAQANENRMRFPALIVNHLQNRYLRKAGTVTKTRHVCHLFRRGDSLLGPMNRRSTRDRS